MAQEWETEMGMDLGRGMRMGMGPSSFSTKASPEAAAAFSDAVASPPASHYGLIPTSSEPLIIDDLLDFSNHDLFPTSAETQFFPPNEHPVKATGGSRPVSEDRTNSSSSGFFQSQASSFDVYVPYEEAAELEWLSKFVDDSFSDLPDYNSTLIAPAIIKTKSMQMQQERSSIDATCGARSKRSRVTAGAAVWSSTLIPPPNQSSPSSSSSSSYSSSELPVPNSNAGHRSNAGAHIGRGRGKKGGGGGSAGMEEGVRRCMHCASEKTPQWRTGPLGPKTLCNACGVRYKSGRLVPEYRPAASPTFVLTQHSNSHRKVMELRRQKEFLLLDNADADAATEARPERVFDGNQYGVC